MQQIKPFHIAFSLLGAIIFFFFYLITSQLHEKLDTTINEQKGLVELHTLSDLIELLQDYRSLNSLSIVCTNTKEQQLYSVQAQEIKQTIEEKFLLMEDQKLAQLIHQDLDHLPTNINEKFNLISAMINRLYEKGQDIADKNELLYEDNRENYLLMQIIVQLTPNLLESAAQLRGLSVLNATKNEKQIREKQTIFSHYITLIHNISLLEDENSLFEHEIRNILLLNQKYTSLLSSQYDCSPTQCFHEGSSLLSAIQDFSNKASKQLDDNLHERSKELKQKIFLSYSVFLISILLLTSLIVYLSKRAKASIKQEKKEKREFLFIDQMQFTLKEANRLKGVCDEALSYIATYYQASTAVLYLYNTRNNQLDLSSTYGLNPKTLSYTLEIGEGIIGQNAIEQLIKEVVVEEFSEESIVEMGAIIGKAKKVVTFPLIHLKNHIGNIQLVLLHDTEIDRTFLTRIAEMASGYIHKAIKVEESRKYLMAIDDHVITSSTNAQGIITEVSHAFEVISGYKKEELLGRKHNIVRHPDMPESLFKDLWKTISKGHSWRGEVKNLKKDGGYYWVDVVITPNFNLYDKIIGYTAIRHDISDRKQVEEIAVTDGLTNIFNRRHFDNQFPHKLEISHRYNLALVFVLIDIDHFKLYNDTYGHQDGDSTLKHVAQTLNNILHRPDDLAFRLGGEEFGLLFSANSLEDAEKFILSAKDSVEQLHIKHKHNSASPYVTISMGAIYITPNTDKTPQELYKAADEMLYEAKENGRNTLRIKAIS